MYKAQITTHWEEISPTKRAIKLTLDYPSIERCDDVSGTPAENVVPETNVLVVECLLTQELLNTILADSNYGEGAFLWYEEIINEP